MRALIRVTISDPQGKLPEREDRSDYDKLVISLLKEIGYDPRSLQSRSGLPTQTDLEESEEVKALFENIQGTIYQEEKKHLVMLGYTSAGQAKFVVCSINRTVLHIRVRDDLFEKLRLACSEICTLVWRHEKRYRRTPMTFWRTKHPHFALHTQIEVMEPEHKTATILGRIIRRPLAALPQYHWTETIITMLSLLGSGVLFWTAPDLAPPLTRLLAPIKQFDPPYIQGALERTYSALLITSAVTAIDLTIKYLAYRRARPIMWNAGIEPSGGPSD